MKAICRLKKPKKTPGQAYRDRDEVFFLRNVIDALVDEGYSFGDVGQRTVHIYRAYREWASGGKP